METIEELKVKIEELEAKLRPLQFKLEQLYRDRELSTEERVKLAQNGHGDFRLGELVFAAASRCPCGAGLAYPKNVGMHGSWDCSDILRGLAKPKGHPESKQHSAAMPFIFWEVKSEGQPSANGATTRPQE
jgi:hypothetical protein